MRICKLTCFCLISTIVLFWGCNNNIHQGQTHDEKVLYGYLESLGLSVPTDPHTFIFIPNAACPGCKKMALHYAETYSSDTLTCVVARETFLKESLSPNGYIIVDSSGLLDKLNWEYCGITEIRTDNGEIKMIETYDASNSTQRFMGETMPSSCPIDCEECRLQCK